MQLEQQVEIKQTLKVKLIYSFSVIILIAVSASLIFSNPVKNFIRTYKPLPTSELHKN